MMIEAIIFNLPDGMIHKQLLKNYKETAPKWRAMGELIRKSFLYDEEKRTGGGVYHWKSAEAANLWHGDN